MRRHWLQQGRRRCASGIPAQQAPQLPHAHIAHCPAEEEGGGGPGQAERPGISSCVTAITHSLEGY